ncbi:tryptophan-rich sensory protein [Candidatus Woesearchaeota archaeon]|nr:tryptophan-rich sensory protein [Candidatus Woesearchaeota archaeon]
MNQDSKKNWLLKLISSIVICQLAGIIGSVFTISSVSTWYQTLNKPFFNPPSWLFGPVWTILYLMMGISLYLVWIKGIKTKNEKIAVYLFLFQLVLNLLWSILFFGIRSPLFALIEIIILWAVILLTIGYFYRISKPASYLLMPYIAWVSFAAVLNFFIYYLN